jgi:hypothetical protein
VLAVAASEAAPVAIDNGSMLVCCLRGHWLYGQKIIQDHGKLIKRKMTHLQSATEEAIFPAPCDSTDLSHLIHLVIETSCSDGGSKTYY